MPPKKASNKKGDDKEFDQLMQQLAKQTAAAAPKKKAQLGMTADERRAKHKERSQLASMAKQADMERHLQARRQQEKIRKMIFDQMLSNSAFLSSPNTDIKSESKENSCFAAAAAAMQGWRRNMEDAHTMLPEFKVAEKSGLFCVFDGHAGEEASKVANALMPIILMQHLKKPADVTKEDAYIEAFKALDKTIEKRLPPSTIGQGGTPGTTAVATVVTPSHVVCASVGDSRAVLSRGGKAIPLSFDHKPDDEEEKKRILEAGGSVSNNRVDGALAMSRAIGDFGYKSEKDKQPHEQKVSCIPTVIVEERQPEDDFVVVACDGIFDVLTNDEVIEFVAGEIAAKRKTTGVATGALPLPVLEEVAANVTKRCLAPAGPGGPMRGEGSDNMSIIVAMFK